MWIRTARRQDAVTVGVLPLWLICIHLGHDAHDMRTLA